MVFVLLSFALMNRNTQNGTGRPARGQRWGFLTCGQCRLCRLLPSPRPPSARIHRAGGFVAITRVSFKATALSGGCLKRDVITLIYAHACAYVVLVCSRVPAADGFLKPRVPRASVSSSRDTGREGGGASSGQVGKAKYSTCASARSSPRTEERPAALAV